MNDWVPEDPRLEQFVLGAVFLDPDDAAVALEELQPLDFSVEKHGKVFEALREMYALGTTIDLLTLVHHLEQSDRLDAFGGKQMAEEYLMSLSNEVVSSANIVAHVRMVKDLSIRRRAGRGYRILAAKSDEPQISTETLLSEGESLILSLSERRFAQGLRPFSSFIGKTLEQLAKVSSGELTGVPTGLKDIDRITGGLQPTDFIVLAGRPAMGKTGLGLSIAWRSAKYHGKKVAFFSLEMGAEQLQQRVLCAWRNVDLHKLRTGKLEAEKFPLFEEALKQLAPIPLHIDDASQKTPLQILSQCKRMKKTFGLDLVILDYLQLGSMDTRPETRAQEVGEFARGCKRVAKDLHIPVIGLAQLNRDVEKRGSIEHRMSDLKESGGIEEAADIVGILDRPEVHHKDAEPGLAKLHIVKFRNGPTGAIPLRFNKESASFSDYIEPSLLEGMEHGRYSPAANRNGPPPAPSQVARRHSGPNVRYPQSASRPPRPGEPGFDG